MTPLIEQIARALAPHLEGGRDFDQMPRDRATRREWHRANMCSANDTTQEDALAAAQAVLPFIAAETERCVEAQRYAATVMHELSQAKAEISTLRDCIVTYGDRVRMATAADMTMQQAIDRAFDREP